MPIPQYQTIMLPLLQTLRDGKIHTLKDVVAILAKRFKLKDEEVSMLLPSGSFTFANRVGWAKTYLKKAGLVEAPKRATIRISKRGAEVLNSNPDKIDNVFLKQFSTFSEFYYRDNNGNTDTLPAAAVIHSEKETPEETINLAYQTIRQTLAQELIDAVRNLSPNFFERLVVELLVKMGYGGSMKDAGNTIGKTGDEGIDGTIKEDKLGLDIIYIQAKRWQSGNIVGRPEIQRFVGALAGQGAKKGVFITTSSFSKEALSYIPRNETKIVLIDGVQLAQLMIDYNLGVSAHRSYEIKKMDSDYFAEI